MPDRIDKRRIRHLHGRGWTDPAIARHLGCTARYVCLVRAWLRLPCVSGRNRSWRPSDAAEVMSLLAGGLDRRRIAERVGRTYLAVRDRIQAERRGRSC